MAAVATRTFKEQFPWDQTDKLLANLRSLMAVLDATLLPLIAAKGEYENATAETRAIILQRFNTQIQPIFDEILSATSLGAIFTCNSLTPIKVGLGYKTFIIDRGSWLLFTPSPYMAAVSASDGRRAMTGVFVSFDRGTGQLVMNVLTLTGDGATAADWYISATPPPYVPQAIDAGVIGDTPDRESVSFTYIREDLGSDGNGYV